MYNEITLRLKLDKLPKTGNILKLRRGFDKCAMFID